MIYSQTTGKLHGDWESCLIGFEHGCYIYSYELMVDKAKKDLKINDRSVAAEWIDYNIIGFLTDTPNAPRIYMDTILHHSDNDMFIPSFELGE